MAISSKDKKSWSGLSIFLDNSWVKLEVGIDLRIQAWKRTRQSAEVVRTVKRKEQLLKAA